MYMCIQISKRCNESVGDNMNKPMTVAELSAYLRTIPNQNLPVKITGVNGTVSYADYDDAACELHMSAYDDSDDFDRALRKSQQYAKLYGF